MSEPLRNFWKNGGWLFTLLAAAFTGANAAWVSRQNEYVRANYVQRSEYTAVATELTELRKDISALKQSSGRIEGMMSEHLRNDRKGL